MVQPGQSQCPKPKKVVIDKIPAGLFPDAPVIQILPSGTDTVYAASVIRASRDLTKEHNKAKAENVKAANVHVVNSVASYNEYLEAREVSCTPKTDEIQNAKKKKRFVLF